MSVGFLEGARNLQRKPYRLVRWKWPTERLPLHILQHQVVGSDIVDLADMRMIQCGDCARFLFEPFAVLSRQPLDGDGAIQARIARFVDFAHTAGADGGKDFVWAKPSTDDQCHRSRAHR
jgi:hypothetical protein